MKILTFATSPTSLKPIQKASFQVTRGLELPDYLSSLTITCPPPPTPSPEAGVVNTFLKKTVPKQIDSLADTINKYEAWVAEHRG